MFIEVYAIPTANWNLPAVTSSEPENRRLISVSCIKTVTCSNKCEGRAEIELCTGEKLTVVGSYDEITERLGNAVHFDKNIRVG